jgi:ribonuclease P protein component
VTWSGERLHQVSDVMYKKHRLRASADFERLRRQGQTVAHPLMVLSYLPNEQTQSRFGFVVGGRIGKAVERNRIKRRMREAVRLRIQKHEIAGGWDVALIARRPIKDASFQQVDEAIGLLLCRAGLQREME